MVALETYYGPKGILYLRGVLVGGGVAVGGVFASLVNLYLTLSNVTRALAFSRTNVTVGSNNVCISGTRGRVFSSINVARFRPGVSLASAIANRIFIYIRSLSRGSSVTLYTVSNSYIGALGGGGCVTGGRKAFATGTIISVRVR